MLLVVITTLMIIQILNGSNSVIYMFMLDRTQMKDYTLIDHLTNIKILILDKCPLETIPIPVCYLYNL